MARLLFAFLLFGLANLSPAMSSDTSTIDYCSGQSSCVVVCPQGYTTQSVSCLYSADVSIPYWLPTTVTVTAATVYYAVSDGTTRTNTVTRNLTSYYSSIATALVPTAQTEGAGPWLGISTVDLVFGTTEVDGQYTLYAQRSVSSLF
jgi:hypothetical protein